MKFGKKIAATLLGILCTGCIAGGLSACKAKGPTSTPDNATTYRLALPNDGSAPTAHTGLENIGYMAYALDKQEYYHAYAYGTAKSLGYTQTTQTWKDYKEGVMICSDITYSSLVKAGTQACFVNNEVYMRTSDTPGKSTTGTTAKWKTSKPTYYDRDKYLSTYGEFSTELSVYIINEETIKSCGEVVVNDDGTYSQSFSLNSGAAYYYQYGMKTRGDLKGYPEFSSINITFTFDGNWTVLSSYCEEKASIAPNSLGGIPMDSTSKVTTTFSYGADEFDEDHYGYYESYYKQYVGQIENIGGDEGEVEPDLLSVLGNAFGSVVAGGEQFGVELKIGQTDYEGKIYLSLADLSDVLGSIDARLALGVKGSGRQDFYLDFSGGAVNAYYSDDFAATLNVDAVSTIISQFGEWASKLSKSGASTVSYALTDGDSDDGGLDLSSLLSMLKMEYDDSTVTISVETDDLLGTGIGVRLYLYFNRDGNSYIFNYVELESIAYNSTSIDLYAKISPDKDGEIISHNKADAAANLADYASGIYSMLDSDTLKVTLDFDGSKQDVIGMLQGISVQAQAYVELGYEFASRVNLTVEYAGLTAELAVYYGNNLGFDRAGEIYVDLVKVNGVEIGAKVYCDIDKTVDAVKSLLDLINNNVAASSLASAQSEEAANSVATIINGILNLNFGEVLGDIYASNSQIRVSADIDAIVGALGVNVNGIKFGTAALALGLDNGKANLALSLDALGLTMNVEGSGEQLTLPEKSEYLDAVELVELVSAAVNETKYIIDAQAIAYNIDAYVVVGGVPMQITGSGEVSWADGLVIAVDAVMTVADGTSASEKDEVALKLYYNSAAAEGEPFIRFAVNRFGMEIYDKDLTDSQSGLQKIIDSVNLLINGEKSGNASASVAAELYNTSVALDGGNAGAAVEEVLASDNFQKIFGVVLGFVKDLSVSTGRNVDDGSVTSLIVRHALYGGVTLSAKGGLALEADINDGNGAQILAVKAGVSAGNGSAFASVNSALDGCEMYSTAEMEDSFVKIVYNYLFAVVEEGLSVSQTLGSNTYEVAIHLDGAKSEVSALKEVSVDATLYYTQGLVGDKVKGDKLVEIDLNLTIGTTEVQANVRYNDERIFISLDKVGTTNLNEVKFYASKDDIYAAVEELVRIITDENVITTLAKLVGNSAASVSPDENAIAAQSDDGAVTDLLTKLISFDFANTFSYTSVDGVTTATVNVDKLIALFGADLDFAIGTAKISLDSATHSVNGSVTLNGKEWITLSAAKAAKRSYDSNWQSEYVNVGFVTTLVADMFKTITNDDGEFHTLYTFSGKIEIAIKVSIGISINKTIEMDVIALTAGLDNNGEFYLTLLADLHSCAAGTITIAESNRISITYSNGYVTLGRGVGTSGAVYKVMTLDYLLQNAFAKHSGGLDSPFRWLLGMSDTIWNNIAGYIPSLVSNGTPTYTIYDSLAQASFDSTFYLSKLLTGFAVNVNGDTVTTFGNSSSAATALGLTENYYALELNAKSVTGVLDYLYLALLRDDEQGICGIKAKGSLSASPATITFTVDLNEYKEGVTDFYESGDVIGDVAAPNYFDYVTSNYEIDFDKTFESSDAHIESVFGCYTTNAADPYESVNGYSKITLTIEYGDHLITAYNELGLDLNEDGIYYTADDISYSSIVYLRTPFAPTWVNEAHTYKVIYTTDKEGNNRITDEDEGRIYIQVWGDTTIYAQVEESVKVNFVTGIDGVGTVTGGFVEDAELIEYVISGYDFGGWYADSNYTVEVKYANDGNIQKVDGVLTVYGKYNLSAITINGVIYKYTDNAYEVSGYDEYGISAYTDSGSLLLLESYINGFPVTSIGVSALKGSLVKNVIVPETITVVRAQAFMDNYGIESVVFAADKVYLYGTETSGDNNRFVFFGCSVGDGGNDTKIKIYYNEIDGEGDWTTFRSGKRIGTDAGGTLYAKGTWTYVNFVQEGAVLSHELTSLKNGMHLLSKTADEIKAEVIAEINNNSAANGYINAYTVALDSSLKLNGKINTITVTIEKATPYFLLEVNSDTSNGAIANGDVVIFNGERYVKAGSVVTVNPPEGYKFVSLTGVEHNGYTFVMPNKMLTLEAVCEEYKTVEYTVNSAVAFVLNGVEYKTGSATFTVEEGVGLGVPTAEGYLFLGWAYNNGKELEFVSGDSVVYSNYYAIWAYARKEITSVSIVTEGSDPNASNVEWNASLAAGFEGWYTSDNFVTKVTSLSSYEPLYARVYFTITVKGVVNGVSGIGTSYEITTNGVAKQTTYSTTILEKENVYLNTIEENSVYNVKVESQEDPIIGEIRIKTKESVTGGNNTRAVVVTCSDSSWSVVSDKVAVTGDITFTFTYTK